MSEYRSGWFADPGDKDEEGYDERYPWRAYLQTPLGCYPIDGCWFRSKVDCERFIREDVIGQDILPD